MNSSPTVLPGPDVVTALPVKIARTGPTDHDGLRQCVEDVLARFLDTQRRHLVEIDPALRQVADTVAAFVLRGGKRLRPAFAYWGYRAAGAMHQDEALTSMAALELLHACALIHDDVMDASDTRRGEPAVHRTFATRHTEFGWEGDPTRFGRSAAILLGDLCLAWSDQLFHGCGLPATRLAAVQPVYDGMRTELMAGQYLDVLTQASGETTVERASKVARYKSGKYTVERPLLFGAALAGASADVRAAFSGYGVPLGEAFQLRDDVLGVFGDPRQTGKPAGDDLREGKRTYLVAEALRTASPTQRAALADRLGDPLLDDRGVTELREIITVTGALARTEQRITALTTSALAALVDVTLEPTAAAVLRQLADAATARID